MVQAAEDVLANGATARAGNLQVIVTNRVFILGTKTALREVTHSLS